MAIRAIFGLFSAFYPAAILGRVWAVIVNAFYRMTGRRPQPHIRQEIREILAPSITNIDATSSISRECVPSWLITPLLHSAPNAVFRGNASAYRRSVTEVPFYVLFSVYASTAYYCVCQKIRGGCLMLLAAITHAEPTALHTTFRQKPDGNKAIKPGSGKITSWAWHGLYFTTAVTH